MARASKADKDLIVTLHERHKRATEADHDNRVAALADLKFCYSPGEQWDDTMKSARGNRPCYEYNKLRVSIKRVINELRQQRPAGKVRPTEDADKDTAQALEGLVRNIWANSDGDSVLDQAAEYQVAGGMGAWRIVTRYSRDDAWDQDVAVEAIANPFCLYADPAAKDPCGRDAEYWLLTTRMSRSAYESKWPKAAVVSFDLDTEFDDEDWSDEDSVRVCEYWWREPLADTLLLLSDGRSVAQSSLTDEKMGELAAQGILPVRSRAVQRWQIKMAICSGDAVLERADWAGSMFPFVRVYGDALVIDGKPVWWGLVRHAKDAQRSYNYSRTAMMETIAQSPQAKYLATPEQMAGHLDKWQEAHAKNYPVLLYNADPKASGPPVRAGGADIPAAWINEVQFSSDDIKSTTGIFDASLGARSNETSGVAIRQRQAEGNLATWNFSENLARGVRRTWELLLDLIPAIYDTPRQIRVLGVDGSEKYLAINDGVTDLSRGKYDVTISTGPNFATQRQEAAEVYSAFAQSNPAVFPLAGDLIFKSLDLPYADQIAERMKTLLPPQIQQLESQQGMPPEVAQAMAQVDQAMAQVDQAMQLVQQQGALAQQAMGEAEQAKVEVQKAVADLQVKQAQFKAEIATQSAALTRQEAQLLTKQAAAGVDENSVAVSQDREALSAQVQAALAAIQQQAAEFMTQAAAVIAEMQARTQPQVIVADPPKSKQVVVERINGKLIGTIVEVPQQVQ